MICSELTWRGKLFFILVNSRWKWNEEIISELLTLILPTFKCKNKYWILQFPQGKVFLKGSFVITFNF